MEQVIIARTAVRQADGVKGGDVTRKTKAKPRPARKTKAGKENQSRQGQNSANKVDHSQWDAAHLRRNQAWLALWAARTAIKARIEPEAPI